MAKKKRSPQLVAVEGEPARIDLDLLLFDPANPRTVEQLGARPTQAEIERLLLHGDMKAAELIPSFVENGYIPYEPMIVKPHGEKFTVVEGNRRLAALRSLRDSDDPDEKAAFARHSLNSVPCLVFTGDDRQLLAYLGLRHLSKTKDWSTNAKGRFVERILESGLSLSDAARITNTTTNSLRLILLTRRMFDRADELGMGLPSPSQAEGETLFWHLGDAIRRTHTKNYLRLEENENPLEPPALDETRFEKLVTWLYGNSKTKQRPLINSIRDIPSLNDCLANDRATRALEGGAPLQDAIEDLQAGGAQVTAHLARARKSIQRATGGLSDVVDKEGFAKVKESCTELRSAIDQFDSSLEARGKKLRL